MRGGRDWWMRHSRWLLWPLLSAGMFTWVGFAYIAHTARQRRWGVWAALYGLGAALTMTLVTVTSPPDEAGQGEPDTAAGLVGLLILGFWVGGVAHALVVNRSWLEWRVRSGTVPPPALQPQPAHRPQLPVVDRTVATRFTPMVVEAHAARQRFHALLATLPPGPLRSRLEELSPRLDTGVRAVAETVRRAEEIESILTALEGERVVADLARARSEGASPEVLAAYEEEAASVQRLASALEHTTNQLRLLNVRLDGAVVRAAEIAVTADDVTNPGAGLTSVVHDLDALHASLQQVAHTSRGD